MRFELSDDSLVIVVVFAIYIIGMMAVGILSHRYLSKGTFLKEYYLGNRGLGSWLLALTVAATAASGGSFMGFPSLIYSKGWVMGLWICSYMTVPMMAMLLLGKRLAQAARLSGAVTVSDVFRDRFNSPWLGVTSSLIILIFTAINLVGQFKAGGVLMNEVLQLPKAEATFVDAEVNPQKKLLELNFDLGANGEDRVSTPLPGEGARYLPEKTTVDGEKQTVTVTFLTRASGDTPSEEREVTVYFPAQKAHVPGFSTPVEVGYLIGLCIFAITVVAYTTYGGFWAVTWNDFLQGCVMFIGVVLMVILVLQQVPEFNGKVGLAAATEKLHSIQREGTPAGSLTTGPGPGAFLPFGLALSYFLMWSVMGPGQPSGMVRLMSFKDSVSLRRATILISIYYTIIYLCLVVIFVCARAIFPNEYVEGTGTRGQPDSIMPAMCRHLAHPVVAAILLAAPYSAIMSTVSSFLLMISSSLVRDLYQRMINPDVSERTIKIISYLVTGLVGFVILVCAIDPPTYLQYVIVFTGTGMGCAFLVPMLMGLYWRRATRQGVLASMIGGFVVVFGLHLLGWIDSASQKVLAEHKSEVKLAEEKGESPPEEPATARWLQDNFKWIPNWGAKRPSSFAPLYVGMLDTVFWGMLVSLGLCVGVSLMTRPDERLVAKYFP
jgi:Na+/proline symporter